MINGAISGVFSTVFSLPFQVISTNMKLINLSKKDSERIKTIQMIKSIYKKEGLKGFYRGFIPNLIKITLSDAIFFRTLETSQYILKNKFHTNEFLTHSLSSSIAMITNCTIVNPLLVISTRNEKLGFNKYKHLIDGFNQIYKNEGLKAFTKGLKPLIIKEVPSKTLFYILYQYIMKIFEKNKNKNLYYLNKLSSPLSAIISGIITTMIDNPFDYIRTMAQYKGVNKKFDESDVKNNQIWYNIKKIIKEEGLYGLEKGVVPILYRKVISGTITVSVYKLLKERKSKI